MADRPRLQPRPTAAAMENGVATTAHTPPPPHQSSSRHTKVTATERSVELQPQQQHADDDDDEEVKLAKAAALQASAILKRQAAHHGAADSSASSSLLSLSLMGGSSSGSGALIDGSSMHATADSEQARIVDQWKKDHSRHSANRNNRTTTSTTGAKLLHHGTAASSYHGGQGPAGGATNNNQKATSASATRRTSSSPRRRIPSSDVPSSWLPPSPPGGGGATKVSQGKTAVAGRTAASKAKQATTTSAKATAALTKNASKATNEVKTTAGRSAAAAVAKATASSGANAGEAKTASASSGGSAPSAATEDIGESSLVEEEGLRRRRSHGRPLSSTTSDAAPASPPPSAAAAASLSHTTAATRRAAPNRRPGVETNKKKEEGPWHRRLYRKAASYLGLTPPIADTPTPPHAAQPPPQVTYYMTKLTSDDVRFGWIVLHVALAIAAVTGTMWFSSVLVHCVMYRWFVVLPAKEEAATTAAAMGTASGRAALEGSAAAAASNSGSGGEVGVSPTAAFGPPFSSNRIGSPSWEDDAAAMASSSSRQRARTRTRSYSSSSAPLQLPPSVPSLSSPTPSSEQQTAGTDTIYPPPTEDELYLHSLHPTATLAEVRRFYKARKYVVEDASVKLNEYLDWRYKCRLDDGGEEDGGDDSDNRVDGEDADERHWRRAAYAAVELDAIDRGDASVSSDLKKHRLPRLVSTYDYGNNDDGAIPAENGNANDASNDAIIRGRDGTRIIHVLPAQLNPKLVSYDVYALAVALYLDSKLNRTNDEKVTVVIDVRGGTGWYNPSPVTVLPFIQSVSTLLGDHFPERLERCVLFPMPFAATWIWNGARKFLDPDTAGKIEVCPGAGSESSPVPEKLGDFFDEGTLSAMEGRRVSLFR